MVGETIITLGLGWENSNISLFGLLLLRYCFHYNSYSLCLSLSPSVSLSYCYFLSTYTTLRYFHSMRHHPQIHTQRLLLDCVREKKKKENFSVHNLWNEKGEREGGSHINRQSHHHSWYLPPQFFIFQFSLLCFSTLKRLGNTTQLTQIEE